MARTRHDRADSVVRPPKSHQPLTTILKVIDPIPDDLIFEVLKAEIWSLDGRGFVNPLETHMRGSFRVFGTLRVEKQLEGHLCRGAKNGPMDFEAVTSSYSFGSSDEGISIWIGTGCGYLEIRPSAQYATLFDQMEKQVGLIYQCIDMEDELKAARRILKIEEFLIEYALMDGRGLSEVHLLKHLEDNAMPILSHMHLISDMKNKKLCLWLIKNFPGQYKYIQEQVRKKAKAAREGLAFDLPVRPMSPPRSSAALSSQNIIEVGSSPESSPDPVAQPLRPVASASTSPQRSARNTGDLATELPPVDVLLEIINKASPSNPQFKGPALHNTMYQEWSLWWPSVAKGIVRLHASEVLMKLPPAWKGTKLHDDLKVMAKEVPPARRSKEMKAAAQDGRVPAQRRGMPTSDIHKISDSDWFYNAAAYLTVKRRLKKCQTRVTPTPPVTKGKRQTGELDEGMENYIGTLDAAPVANSHAAANSRSVAAQHDLSTREGRKAAHKVWLETITSRTRSPSPDRGSYNYQLAVRSLHEAKVAQVTGSPNVSKSQLRPQFAPDGNTPHSQKALPHTFEGKPSGKGSRLKPKSSKRPTDDGSPDDRHRKRARLSASPSSEMDEDPESPTPLRRSSSRSRSPSFNDEEPIDDDPDNPFKPSTLNMTRGPLGILRCRTFQCHFVENNPDTTQGRARMEAHYEVHRKEDPMIVLAREEAKLNGRKVSYLMEKIQKMEAEEKSKDDGGKGKGRLGGEKVVLDSFGQPFPARIIRRIGGIGG